ncbi:MAG: glycosyltransferase family 2 protein [Treponemataceae bacterium]
MPKVSVLVPVYNTQKYLAQCLNSVINQTLQDIEIIVINDGSTDSSLEIIESFAQKDNRIKIINKDNTGYGHSMNEGIRLSCAEYIGIVESDDYILPAMYETLYNKAIEHSVDIIKSDFYKLVKEKNYYTKLGCGYEYLYNSILNPQEEFKAFHFWVNTWTGLYKTDFLKKNNIFHNETAGASYQDSGFCFLGFAYAQRVFFLDKAFYMYRCDNPNSSVNLTDTKMMCMIEEFQLLEKQLLERFPLRVELQYLFAEKYYQALYFIFKQLAKHNKQEFLHTMQNEFKRLNAKNYIQKDFFTEQDYERIQTLVFDCKKFKNQEKILYKILRKIKMIARQRSSKLCNLKP